LAAAHPPDADEFASDDELDDFDPDQMEGHDDDDEGASKRTGGRTPGAKNSVYAVIKSFEVDACEDGDKKAKKKEALKWMKSYDDNDGGTSWSNHLVSNSIETVYVCRSHKNCEKRLTLRYSETLNAWEVRITAEVIHSERVATKADNVCVKGILGEWHKELHQRRTRRASW
jgi:hypothetical protein